MSPAATLLQQWRDGLSSLVRARCQVCGGIRPNIDGDGQVCAACREEVAPVLKGCCSRCGLPYALETDDHVCLKCRHSPPLWEGFAVHGIYEGVLRDLLLAFKFRGELGLSSLLQEFMVLAHERWLGPTRPEGIVPVPLHSRRLLFRGYNQSLEMARKLSRATGAPLLKKALVRHRHTRPQQGLDRRERLANLKRAFSGDPLQIQGRHLLLVDDIFTTGSTLAECAKELKRCGAGRIDALVLARAR